MANYYAVRQGLQVSFPRPLANTRIHWLRVFGAICAWQSRRQTRKVLEALPPELLEDLGVPHVGCSPTAGTLDRYDEIITPHSGL